jgi:putative methionine-R-sulfoxide reductase with GAF domain
MGIDAGGIWPARGSWPTSEGARPVDESEQTITRLCEETAERLAAVLPDGEIGCLFRYGDTFRHVAHRGDLRLIYEIPHEQGGVVWRAAECGETQRVADVRADPDYLASDERVRSEVATPVTVGGQVVAVLDVEFPERVFESEEAETIEAEAERLAGELAPYVQGRSTPYA